jgi:hypothetical protein
MKKYKIEDYIALIEQHIAVFSRLNEIFENPPSEEDIAEIEKFKELLSFLKEAQNNFDSLIKNLCDSAMKDITLAETILDSLKK